VYHPYLTLHSEQCGYSLKAQCNLFRSIKPLFANKMVFVVLNKMDIKTFEELDQEMQTELQDLTKSGDVELLRASCATQDGVQDVKNLVCEKLLAERVSQKLKAGTSSSGALGSRLTEVMARIHVAQPMDGITRETFIPEGVKGVKKYDKADPERRMLAKDEEEANGGAGVFNVDLKRDYLLADPSWKYDKIPEILDGKNVYDYIDPDIEAKMAALEEEEERLEKEGFYESDEDLGDESEEEVLQKAEYIREKHKLIRNEAKMRKSLKNRAIIPRKQQKKSFSKLEDHLDQLGVDTESIGLRGRSEVRETRGRSVTRSRAGTTDPDAMDVDNAPTAKQRLRSQSHVRDRSVMATNRREDGVTDELMRTKAERVAKLGQRKMNRMARQGEADRHVAAAMPKHLVSSALCTVVLASVVSNVCSLTTTVRRQAYDRQDAASLSSFFNLCGWQRRSGGNGVWITGVAVVDQSSAEREAMLNGKGAEAGKRRREKKDYPWSLVSFCRYICHFWRSGLNGLALF
jgi:nucleolar GTP-binding protein